MVTDKDPLVEAHRAILGEIRRRGLCAGCTLSEDHCWVRVELQNEGRNVWVGHRPGKGYFLSWRRTPEDGPFFELHGSGLSQLLALIPEAPNDGADTQADVDRAVELLQVLRSDTPDAERIEQILDETPSTPEGLDIFATAACLKRYRIAVNRLRDMIEAQSKTPHEERVYQTLIGAHPWMLGSQYCQVLGEETTIWFDSRIDLLLCSAMGHIDIVELKRPDTRLLVSGTHPKTWRASRDLSDALSQARKYLQQIDEHRLDIVRALGLPHQSVPRLYRSSVIIVLGRTPRDEDALEALRDLNVETARILIMTYDDVVAVADATIAIFERRLADPSLQIGTGASGGQGHCS